MDDAFLNKVTMSNITFSKAQVYEYYDLQAFADWLIRMEDGLSEERQTITLTQIIERAKEARNKTL